MKQPRPVTGSAPSVSPLALERYKPVSESLEWRIGQIYWAVRGTRAFLANDIPHLITNDGMHAARAADVLFAGCAAAAQAGCLEEVIEVAEFGIGLGLHADLFLNRFQARCVADDADFYERLRFYATDRSRKMLSDVAASGALKDHGDHVCLGYLDAGDPSRFVDLESGTEIELHGLRAVLHSYVLDALGFDVLLHNGEQWMRLHLQTYIDDVEAARRGTDMEVPQLLTAAASENEAEMARLLPLYDLLDVDRAYMPVDIQRIPFGPRLPSFVEMIRAAHPNVHPDGAFDVCVNHSHGAAASLIATLGLLRRDGFVLFSDYGSTELEITSAQHQRFAGSRSMGLNFALLRHLFDRHDPGPPRFVAPAGDERALIHTRLLSLETLPEVEEVFRAGFAQAYFEALGELMQQARVARTDGDMESAQSLYARAHRQYPENWYVLIEWAEFATYGLGDPALGVTLAEQAMFMNRINSPLVHNVYGEALYRVGRREEARAAYHEALRIQPDDIRAHGSLARAYADEGRYREAVLEISLAVANDSAGAYRQNLVGKLNEILDRRDAARDGNQGQPTGRMERHTLQG